MLGRDDIEVLNRRMVQEFVPPQGETVWHWGLRTTSGTTGRPIVAVVERKELEWFYRARRSVVCMGTMGIRLHAVKTVRRDPLGENQVLAIDAKDLAPELEPALKDYKPDLFVGFPSFMLRVAEYLDAETAEGVEGINFLGESMTPALEDVFRARFPRARMRGMYVAAEFGVMSKPNCPYLPRNWYHPLTGVTLEVHEPDETGAGDLLVSGLRNGRIMVERYRVGDMGRLKHEFCACGESSAFEVLGRRGYDYIKLAGALLRQEEFDRVAKLLGAFDDYRAEVEQVVEQGRQKGKVLLRIFVGNAPKKDLSAGEIAERFSQELFVTQTKTLADLIESGEFAALAISKADRPFERKHKDIKLVQKHTA